MPYEMRKDGPEGKQWCVYNKVTGKRKGCSVTKKLAKEFMAKLYVEEGKKEMGDKITYVIIEDVEGVRYKASYLTAEDGGLSITEKNRWLEFKDVSLNDQSRRARKAFHNKFGSGYGYYGESYWVNVVFAGYLIVEDYSDYNLYKVSYTEGDDGYEFAEKEDWQKVEVEYVEKEVSLVEEKEETQGLVDKVKQLWEKVFPSEPVPLFVTKQQEDGRFRWVMISSTAFLDGEEEIVSTKALADNQPLAEKDYGELRFWHLPIKLGNGDFQMADGVCLVESGLWDDTEIANPIRKAIDEKPRDWKASIGFLPLQDPSENVLIKSTIVKKVWDAIQIKERSVLPKKYAANKFACIVTEGGITVDEKKEKVLRELLGDDLATQVISNVDELNKKALEDNAVVKGQEEPTPDPAPAPEPDPEKEVTVEELREVLKELGSLPDRFDKLEEDIQKLKDDIAPRGVVAKDKASEDRDTVVSGEEVKDLVGPTEFKAIDDIVDTMLGEN